ncbi:MAG TPA: hypothetical protein VNU97_15225 [Rhizomicrobium sp.]|nr:hypothetical protein [Rhizomicrobium sp.]
MSEERSYARWPMGFARAYLPAMVESGDVSQDEAAHLAEILSAHEADPNALVVTPGVLQIQAAKPEQKAACCVSIA